MAVGKLVPEDTVFFLCDVQTRFSMCTSPIRKSLSLILLFTGSLIHGFEDVVATANKMLKIAKVCSQMHCKSPFGVIDLTVFM
jgi:hypothetical protein